MYRSLDMSPLLLLFQLNGPHPSTGISSSMVSALSLICTNDLVNCVNTEASISLYADDCTYFMPCDDLTVGIDKANRDLNQLASWYSGYKLSLNHSKTKAMIFHTCTLPKLSKTIWINSM